MKKTKEELKTLSFWGMISRNFLLLSVMFVALSIGIFVHLTDKTTLNGYVLRVSADKLGFIFFIIFAACYVSVLFIRKINYWTNFFIQLLVSSILFILLLLLFNPVIRLDFTSTTLSTRSWDKVKVLPFGKVVYFTWLKLPDPTNKVFVEGVSCPERQKVYIFNFVITYRHSIPYQDYERNAGVQGKACNLKVKQLYKTWPSLERALIKGQYDYFKKLDYNTEDSIWQDKPLVLNINQLPDVLRLKVIKYAKDRGKTPKGYWLKPSVVRTILGDNKVSNDLKE